MTIRKVPKRKLLQKGGCAVTALTLLIGTSSTVVLAKDNDKNYVNEASRAANKKYTFQYLNRLSYDELVKVIKKISWEDVPGLFEYSSDSYEFFNNSDRVQAIINGLEQSGSEFNSDDNKGIPTLVEFLRAGFYLGYYHQDKLGYLNDVNFQNKCLGALRAIQNNPYFRFGTKVQDSVVDSFGKFAGNGSLDVGIINNLAPILNQYYNNIYEYSKDTGKNSAIYDIMNGVDYFIYSELYRNGYKPENTKYKNNIDTYLDSLQNLTAISNRLDKNNEWLVNNCVFYTGKDARFRSNPRASQQTIESLLPSLTKFSNPYLECLAALKDNFNSKFSNGSSINYEEEMNAAKEKFLPKKYTFDDGKVIVKTGNKVSEEKVKRLYWASKEVKSQFARVIGNDQPLEKGHADDVLNIVIYNSPDEYKLNQKLYGYNTDNGGIYIEGTGTFFTYERTPQESIYTLEELFRHEFTHYLQGRYLVPGIWGQGDFYKGDSSRLTWYEEGTAEFFAGSTRTNDIKPRKSIVNNLRPNREDRESATEILHAKYGSWDFYNYGFAFADYMYNDNLTVFQTLDDYIKSNNVQGYSNYVEHLSNDSYFDDTYQKHMEKLIGEKDSLDVPLVSDDYIKSHPYKKSAEVYNDIKSVLNISNIKTNEEKSDFFNTFDLSGSYTGGKSVNRVSDWKDMNAKIDAALKELDNKGWSGYKTVTAYFTDYKVDKDGNYTFNIHFHGLLTDKINSKPENKLPVAKIEASKNEVNTLEEVQFNGKKSSDEDGKIQNYKWDFGDGTQSEGDTVTHKFKKVGDYKVKLTVTDNDGGATETVLNIKVKEKIEDQPVKPSDEEKAIGIFESGKTFENSISGKNSKQVYYFDVEKEGDIDIKLNNKDNIPMTWYAVNKEDTKKYLAYPKQNKDLNGKFHAKPGRYYINVYTYDSNSKEGKFDLSVNGNVKKKILEEVEDNNDFNKAMNIPGTSVIKGSVLSEKDDKDIYKINIKNPSDLKISLDCAKDSKINWILYNAKDVNNYISYAIKKDGKLQNQYKAEAGEYYLCVYATDKGNKIDYSLNVNYN